MSRFSFFTRWLVYIFVFSFSFSNLTTFSQSMLPIGSFFVSEINWDGSWIKETSTNQFKSNSDDEWVEFYNPTTKEFGLNDYSIKGFSSSGKDLTYKDIAKCIIKPNSYLIVKRLTESPTIPASEDCTALNMSISNTNLIFEVKDKNSVIIDSSNIGNPSKLTPNKSINKKFSISRIENSWVESNQTINLTQQIDSDLSFQHFATPGENNLIQVITDIPSTITSKTLPYELKFSFSITKNSLNSVSTVLNKQLYKNECGDKINLLPDLKIQTSSKYCLRVLYQMKKNDLVYLGFKDQDFDFTLEVVTPPTSNIPSIKITELDLNKDQVEIYNFGEEDFDLSDLYLQDNLGSVKKSKMVGWVVKPQSYNVFNTKTIGITLNNDGDNLDIFDSKNQKIASSSITINKKTQSKDESWQYFEDTKTWEEYLSTLGRENLRNTKVVDSKTDTKEKPKNTFKSQPLKYYQNNLIINEIYPEGEEFVEFFNQSDQTLDLQGLKILDLQGKIGTLEISESVKIRPQEYLTIGLKSKISLNNNGDGIRVLTSDGEEIESVSYQKSQGKEKSFQRFGNDWFWASTTPAKINQKDVETPEKPDESSKKSNMTNESQMTDCTDLEIYIQTSKNIFYSNLGKISIKNTTTQDLPAKITICNLKKQEEQSTANFKSWDYKLDIGQTQSLSDIKSPENLKFVNFNLACKGKKNVDIIREDVIFRNVLGVKKPECVNKRVQGYGFVIKTEENYILYHIESNKDSLKSKLGLVRTGGADSLSPFFEFVEDFKSWFRVSLW